MADKKEVRKFTVFDDVWTVVCYPDEAVFQKEAQKLVKKAGAPNHDTAWATGMCVHSLKTIIINDKFDINSTILYHEVAHVFYNKFCRMTYYLHGDLEMLNESHVIFAEQMHCEYWPSVRRQLAKRKV